MYRGYIKIWRKTLESDMYKSLTSTQRDIFIALLLLANHKPKTWEWKGETYACQQGQFITSLESIKKLCSKKVTVRNTRTALNKFTRWQFLTNESTKTGRLITILNWDTYQGTENKTDKETDKAPTKHRQTGDKQVTTNKNDKNVKKEDNIPYAEIISYLNEKTGKHFKPTSKATRGFIHARWEEDKDYQTIDAFKYVIDVKCKEWLGNPKYENYLRPQTLFGNKFDGYLNERA